LRELWGLKMIENCSTGITYRSGVMNSSHEIIDTILQKTGPLPAIALEYENDIKTLWLTIKPEPKPVFTLQLLHSVGKVQKSLHALYGADGQYTSCPVRFLAFKGQGPVFTLGGDLDFYLDCLASNDRQSLEEYARASIEGAAWNASGIKGLLITLSTIHAKAIGGGIDAPRSCNIMIAEEQASFVYPEVKFNHFPIAAVPILSRKMGRAEAQKMLMSGDEYSATELYHRGGLEAVVSQGFGESWIRDYAAKTLPMHAARTALFAAIHHGTGPIEEELTYSAKLWTECMLRLTPMEIAKLQRIAQVQEKMLSRLYQDVSPVAVHAGTGTSMVN
jgi:DSF synthase